MTNPTSESAEQAYDKIDRFLRNNLDDTDYADFSAALELVYADASPILAWNEEPYCPNCNCTSCAEIGLAKFDAAVEAPQADAQTADAWEQGRREGLEQAARVPSAAPAQDAKPVGWIQSDHLTKLMHPERDGQAHFCRMASYAIHPDFKPLYAAPPAQTADARDTERWRALRGACESLIAASEEYDFDDGLGVGILQDAWDEFQTAVDAAEIDPEPDALAIMKTAIAAIQREGDSK